jgi:hypothetical protein
MARHVLLMLSSDQPPHPIEEMRWHARECERGGATALVTTRVLAGLTPGGSTVAFYGNAALGNRYLGCGTYLEYVSLGSPRGAELLAESPLYRKRGVPRGARALVLLRDVCVAQDSDSLVDLRGTIDSSGASNGRPLTLENIPQGAARIQVYFTGPGCPCKSHGGAT